MALNSLKCNHLMPQHIKGLTILETSMSDLIEKIQLLAQFGCTELNG